jgi:drug/metabolite transporter (DMT)-like permease
MPISKSLLPYLWMLSGSVSFALMSALAHGLASRCDWQVIAMARSGLALVFAGLLALAAGSRFVFLRPGVLWMRSLAGSVSVICTFYALTRLPISNVLTLANMFPIWVALLSWPILREVPPGRVWLAVASGIAGVVLIQRPQVGGENLATFVALGASVSTAFAMIGLHRLQGIDARAIVVHFSGVSLLICLASFFVFDHPVASEVNVDGATVGMLCAVGVLATIGQVFLTKAFASGPPASISVVGLTQLDFGMILDMIVWQRSFDSMTLLGMGLVITPSAWLMVARPG